MSSNQSVKVVADVIIYSALALTMWAISAYVTAGEMNLALLFIGFFTFLVAVLIYADKK